VEGGLNKPPLLQPRTAFVDHQPVAKDPAIEPHGLALDEVLVAGHQNVFDQIGVVEEVDVTMKDAVIEDVAVLAGPPRKQSERILASHREVTGYASIPRTRRTNQTRSHSDQMTLFVCVFSGR